MLSKLLSVRTAGIAAAIVLGAATAAAAVTGPPGGRPSFAGDHDTTTTTATTVKSDVTTTSTTEKPEVETPDTADNNNSGTPASVTDPHAQFGLCMAWTHNSQEAKTNSDVFKAFAAAHGGAAGTTSYCQTVISNKKSSHGNSGNHGKP